MSRQIKVHIFSLKPYICTLIKKTISSSNYIVTCTNTSLIREQFLDDFNPEVDCIIIDKDIDKSLKYKIKTKFDDIPIICLPSLDSENPDENGIKYISEPLRLSELAKTLDEIFHI